MKTCTGGNQHPLRKDALCATIVALLRVSFHGLSLRGWVRKVSERCPERPAWTAFPASRSSSVLMFGTSTRVVVASMLNTFLDNQARGRQGDSRNDTPTNSNNDVHRCEHQQQLRASVCQNSTVGGREAALTLLCMPASTTRIIVVTDERQHRRASSLHRSSRQGAALCASGQHCCSTAGGGLCASGQHCCSTAGRSLRVGTALL